MLDTFDTDRSRFFFDLFARTHQGVVGWDSYKDAKISGYFAESWEHVDETTFTFKVRQGLVWHDKAPVNGRAADAEDIAYHIARNKAGKTLDGLDDPNFIRKGDFASFDKAEVIDASTVRVTTTKPNPFLLNTLAERLVFVQAREAVEAFEKEFTKNNPDHLIGTGSFVLTKFSSDGSQSLRRFEKGPRQAWLDGFDMLALSSDPAAQQAAFEQKQIDSFAPSLKSVIDDLKKRYEGKIYEKTTFPISSVSGVYYGGAPPWNNANLIGAIFRILDRRGLVQQLVQGRGALAGYTPPGWAPYALPEKDLITIPGYFEDRDKDYTEAKAMWAAGGGSALGEIVVDIPDIFEAAYSGAASIITNHLSSILGNDFTPSIQPFSTIAPKYVGQKYGNGNANINIGLKNGPPDPDPSQDYINTYNSQGPNYRLHEVAMPNTDSLTAKLSVEFDAAKRVELCHKIEKEILGHYGGGTLPQFQVINSILYHNYYHVGEVSPFITAQNDYRDRWLDQNDPTWQGRPA